MPVNRQFLIFNFGVFLLFSGVIGTLSLVSSINVENGLGEFLFKYGCMEMLLKHTGAQVP